MAEPLAEAAANVEEAPKLPPPPAAQISQPTQATSALISSSPANQATAGASGGAAGAIMVITIWALGHAGVTVPGEVAAAMTFLVGAGVHWAMLTYGLTPASDS